ncbi:hypothetical protein BTVI_85349 [Pitangus sulphuratus]|nr:hypothetical protein BTVI_85349 [Pitangus sulphuratus]
MARRADKGYSDLEGPEIPVEVPQGTPSLQEFKFSALLSDTLEERDAQAAREYFYIEVYLGTEQSQIVEILVDSTGVNPPCGWEAQQSSGSPSQSEKDLKASFKVIKATLAAVSDTNGSGLDPAQSEYGIESNRSTKQ